MTKQLRHVEPGTRVIVDHDGRKDNYVVLAHQESQSNMLRWQRELTVLDPVADDGLPDSRGRIWLSSLHVVEIVDPLVVALEETFGG